MIAPALATAMAVLLAAAAAGAADPGAADANRPPLGHDDTTYTFAFGAFDPSYALPEPGTYQLPPIDVAGDHAVVDAAGRDTTLSQLIAGRFAVVSFIYGTCGEAAGCPMSTAMLQRLDRRIAADPVLSRDVALVTVSFDPQRDTPERLAAMENRRAPGSTWQFVSTRDEASLQPLLDDFGQSVSKLRYADGTWTGVYRHVLKVYLLDRRRQVRNIYSVGFLHPDLVWNDVRTLQMDNTQ